VALSDTLASVDAEIVWNAEKYTKLIQTAIQSVASQLKGRMVVLSGGTNWHSLAAGVPKMLANRQAFPPGTLSRTSNPQRYGLAYPPDHRASFLVEILPFIGKGGLRSTIQADEFAWYAKENMPAAQTWVPEFLVPYYPQTSWRAHHPGRRQVARRDELRRPVRAGAGLGPVQPGRPGRRQAGRDHRVRLGVEAERRD
jgi:hypothetical protein